MTGEITLRGRVLPIGGLKEKILGAKRAGIKHIVFPDKNIADMKDVPTHLTKALQVHDVQDIDKALDVALVGGIAALEARADDGPGSSGKRKASKPTPRRSKSEPGVRA